MRKSLKSFFIAVSLFCWGLPATEAGAFSVQLNGGLQNLAPETEGESSGLTAGLDIFFYEGRILDLFAGVEYAEWKIADGNFYDVEYTVNSYIVPWKLGFNLKYPTEGRIKPFVSLAALYGTYSNEVGQVGFLSTTSNSDLHTVSNDEGTFFGYKAGIGAHVGITENLSLAIEVNSTGGIPEVKVITATGSGAVVDENSPLIGVTAGLRYQFY